MKVTFRALLKTNVHKRIHPVVVLRNQRRSIDSDRSIHSQYSANSLASDEEFFDNIIQKPLGTFVGDKTKTTRNSASNFIDIHKGYSFPIFDIV